MTAIPLPHGDSHAADHAHGHAHGHAHEIGFLKKYVFSIDHKIIGIQFLFMGLAFFVLGGLLALLVRWQLAWPTAELQAKHPVPILSTLLWGQTAADGTVTPGQMPPDFYTMAFSMHATIMIFFVIIPLLVGTFGNYLIPLKIGAGDMAFPFLNGLAFWSALPAGAIMLAGFFMRGGAAAAGWTSYPPLSAILQTGSLGDFAGNLLRVPHSTWPMAPVIMTFFTMFMMIAFICAYHIRIGDQARDPAGARYWAGAAIVGLGLLLLLSMVPNYLPPNVMAARLVIFGSYTPWIAGLLLAVGSAVGWGPSAGLSVALSLVGGVILTRAVQYAAFDGQSCWFLSIFWLGFSSLMGAVNYLTTIIKLRAPGMTMFRMPLSVWSLFITSLLVLLATPVLASALLLNLLEHHVIPAAIAGSDVRLASFFTPINWTLTNQIQGNAGGGFVLLHQHLFWFYSHPAVYIMILPAMGMVSDIMATFARKPVFGYRPMVYAIAGIAFLGFIVWAHHMFQSGMNPTLGTTFAVSTMFIAVPSAIKTFNWLGTLWGGNIKFSVPMWNALAFVSMFVIGGLSGIFMASTAVDVHIHDTYFIVAHIHYVLFGGSTFGIFAAIYYYYPKMFGRMMNDKLGYLHFFLSFLFFNGTFFAMHILGIGGMPRRIANYMNYPTFSHFQPMNEFITYCALGLGLSQIPFVINFIGSWIWGAKAPRNPWRATTLEWETASPPPHGNFEKTPVVYHGPYEYSSPLVEEDYLPQTRRVEGAEKLVMQH